ncbi:hypothetical protein L6164_014319 [Bauhinia variegata]|uniref:Uncharacterized protein n=1 Tax=Bauhinia variegata TaxID=167791 RepID=A0ACB9NI88_BAUVA|nr:hypothetical protein L6164_014319 [Bauhinia variegata]
MPRPGPRPYECAKRAWHSERHQPLRGSIIQQIFRVVKETHSAATKKNKEWQEKLPIVVLKAEEIMYSKANSEAEYLNPDTLWDRLNDAINTIIRRDESTETGELLPPCVEAALNLGCKAVRASRSERHNNPRTYLPHRTQEPSTASTKTSGEACPQYVPLQSGNPSNSARGTIGVSARPTPECNRQANPDNMLMSSSNYAFSQGFPTGVHQPLTVETDTPLGLGSVYPLYYGRTYFEAREPQLRTSTPENTCSDTIFVGKPVLTPIPDTAGIGLFPNFSYSRSQHVINRTAQGTAVNIQDQSQDRECDLSLRLGLCSHPHLSSEKSLACGTEYFGSRGSQEWGNSSYLSLQTHKDFSFNPRRTDYDPFECNLEGENRKRKAPLDNNEEDGQFCRQLGVPSNRFTGRTKGPGL